MAQTTDYFKHIFSIEAEFGNNLEKSFNNRFMLEQLHNYSNKQIKYIHRICATKEEFEFYLKKALLKKYGKYSIIQFSAHGSPKKIYIGKDTYSLDELATLVGSKLQKKIFHFAACETLRLSAKELEQFFKKTKVAAVSGFTKPVTFHESSALEMLYFRMCQNFLEVKSIEKRVNERYKGLVALTGFKIIHR